MKNAHNSNKNRNRRLHRKFVLKHRRKIGLKKKHGK